MNTTVSALQAVYVKIGGSLTDTYDGIADGAPVGGYSLITDVLKAIFVKCGGSLSTVYSDISTEAVSGYSKNADVVGAIGKVVKLYVAPALETKSINPATTTEEYTPSSGKDGFSKVTVNAVTAAIDENIVAENIKKDVVILGVTGSYGA